jgi:hypothetical protein
MSDFWPSGLDMQDTASPEVILSTAGKEWSEESGGVVTLVIQGAESKGGDRLLIVHAKHVPSDRTVKLFSVLHRPNAPYPARIYPDEDKVPDYLKKRYYDPGFSLGSMRAVASVLSEREAREVTNEWVCDTPREFRSHLIEALNQGVVKSEVLGLIAGASSTPEARPGATSTPETPPDADKTQ